MFPDLLFVSICYLMLLYLYTGKDKCTPYSPSYLEWDALSCFLDSTMWGLFKGDVPHSIPDQGIAKREAAPNIPVQGIVNLLKSILGLQIEVRLELGEGSRIFWCTVHMHKHMFQKYPKQILALFQENNPKALA